MLNIIKENGLFFISVLVGSGICQYVGDWWWCAAIAAFCAFLYAKKGFVAFAVGSLAIATLWGLTIIFWNVVGGSPLADKVAGLLSLSSGFTLGIVVTLLGAIIGGLSALCGYYLKEIFNK